MLQNAVAMTTTTTGLGAYDLLPLTGDEAPLFSTFVEAFGNGAQGIPYRVEMLPDWEEGYGTVAAGSPDTLTRTVIRSSNGDAAVNWPAGTKLVVQHFPAEPLRFGAIGSVPVAAGTANAHAVAHVPPLKAIRPGMHGRYYAPNAANSGAMTLAIDGLSAVSLKDADGADIGPGLIRPGAMVKWFAHSPTELRWDRDLSGLVALRRIVASAAAEVVIPLPDDYDQFKFTIDDLAPSSDGAALALIASQDGGSSWIGGASYGVAYLSHNTSTPESNTLAQGGFLLTLAEDTSNPQHGVTADFWPGATGRRAQLRAFAESHYDIPSQFSAQLLSGWLTTTGRVNAVKLTMNSGNIARANVSVFGIKA